MNLFLDKLSLGSLISSYLFIKKIRNEFKYIHIYYLNISKFMFWINNFFNLSIIIPINRFDFQFDSLVADNGKNIGLKAVFEDTQHFFNMINLSELLKQYPLSVYEIDWVKAYLKKKIILNQDENSTIKNINNFLTLIRAIVFYYNSSNVNIENFLMIENMAWRDALNKYGNTFGVKIITYDSYNLNFFHKLFIATA